MRHALSLLCTAVFVAACATPDSGAPALQVGPITTAEAFNANVVGRKLTIGDASMVIASNGTMSGTFNNAPLTGTWVFENGQWCRTLVSHSTQAPTFECQDFEITEAGNVTVTSAAGRSFTYEMS